MWSTRVGLHSLENDTLETALCQLYVESLDALRTERPQFSAALGVTQQRPDGARERPDIVRRDESTVKTSFQDFSRAARTVRSDDGYTDHERLDDHPAKAFVARTRYENRAPAHPGVRIGLKMHESHPFSDAQIVSKPFQVRPLWPVAQDDEVVGYATPERGVGANE